jgi:hypothetical protein
LARLRAHFEYLLGTYQAFGFERGCLLGNLSTEMASLYPQVREALKSLFGQWSGAVAAVLHEAGTIERAMYTRYRKLRVADVQPLPEGITRS